MVDERLSLETLATYCKGTHYIPVQLLTDFNQYTVLVIYSALTILINTNNIFHLSRRAFFLMLSSNNGMVREIWHYVPILYCNPCKTENYGGSLGQLY